MTATTNNTAIDVAGVRAPMRPDERLFRSHIAGGEFQAGAERGRWRLISITWPVAIIAVAAASRPEAPDEYAFRFALDNYSATAPSARIWNDHTDQPLAHTSRPWGAGRVALAFRTDWKGDTCLYLPCDREALPGHDAWLTQHPSMVWRVTSNITLYLRVLYDLLHSRDYTGVRGA